MIAVEQNNLMLHMKNICKSLLVPKIQKYYPKEKIILYNTHKIAYCVQPKVGSSTILTLFVNLIPNLLPKKIPIHRRMYKNFSMKNHQTDSTLEKMVNEKHYFAFSFVRHPFDRLVSAYIDKIKINNNGIFKKHVSEIEHMVLRTPLVPKFIPEICSNMGRIMYK